VVLFGIPIACPADAEGCSDTGTVSGPFGIDLIMSGGLLIVAVLAVIVAVVLIRRR
jgi:hypothetical protein